MAVWNNSNYSNVSTVSRQKTAFTLAEVLITLGIIGVVAAMTIPTLISNKAKQETVSRLRKVYSNLSQTTKMAEYDTGTQVSQWFSNDITTTGSAGAQKFADTYLVPYMKVVHNCGLSVSGTCPSYRVNYISNKGYNDWVWGGDCSKFYLNDGTLIGVKQYDSTYNRFYVYVDINGQAKPNIYGKDVFLFFYYSNGKFIPEGLIDRETALSHATCGCNKTSGSGTYCAGIIMMDGWQIKDDYPW